MQDCSHWPEKVAVEGSGLKDLFIIDVTRGYLPAALLTAAAYASEGGEAFLVNGSTDQDLVKQAYDRFRPACMLAMVGCSPELSVGRGADSDLMVETLPHEGAALLAWMTNRVVDSARGVVLFPAHSPSWAIKATALATRLGYLAWPLEEASGFAYAAPNGIPILVLGEAPGAVGDMLQGREFKHLPGDRAVVQYLQAQGVAVNYLVLINSSDLEPPSYPGPGMATHWTQGLSLLAPLLASYRDTMVIDARAPRADAREVERTVNQKMIDTGMAPEYLAILASPGAIPFIHEPQMSFSQGEDPTREIHLRSNQDLFFDCAEGRLMGRSAGKVSLQILSTKHYDRLEGGFRSRALIFGRPHVEDGVTFAIDEAVGRTQLAPLLDRAGLATTELYDRDCTPAKITQAMRNSGLMFYGGHGSANSLSTHEAPLYAESLPSWLPPGVVYACACSTLYPKAKRYCADGGFSFDEEALPYGEQIGPAFIDRGALAFVGGLTAEDVLLNTPMYVVFAQALVLKGLSVGQAIRSARNHTVTHLATLAQVHPEAYQDYRTGLANTIQQQGLLGDPAFTPYKGTKAAQLPITVTSQTDAIQVSLNIPENAWTRIKVAVNKGKQNKEFHRARFIETFLPIGEDLFNWGETYRIAQMAEEQSETAVISAYLHLTADLPPGRVPTGLSLTKVTADTQECLLCSTKTPVVDALAKFTNYVIPFQGKKPPVRHDQSKGWAFATEEIASGLRIHWLLPTLVIDDPSRQALCLQGATFQLDHAPGTRVEGRLELGHGQGRGGHDTPGAMEGTTGALPDDLLLSLGPVLMSDGEGSAEPRIRVLNQTLSSPGGRWSAWLPIGQAVGVKVDLPLPLYRHAHQAVLSLTPETVGPFDVGTGPISVALKGARTGVLRGSVVDEYTGRTLAGARIRIWRGKRKGTETVLEGYVGEHKADGQGRFELTLPPGSYIASSAHRTDQRYFSGEGSVTVFKERRAHLLIGMEPGAVVTGRIDCQGAYQPKSVKVKLIEHGTAAKGSGEAKVICVGSTRRDGTFEILAPTSKPFDILIQAEGFQQILDQNDHFGYHLDTSEQLERSYVVKGESGN